MVDHLKFMEYSLQIFGVSEINFRGSEQIEIACDQFSVGEDVTQAAASFMLN